MKKTARSIIGAALVALAGCATALDGAESGDPAQDARLAEIVDGNRIYPRWEDFPRRGTDGPTVDQVRVEVGALSADGGALQRQVAGMPILFENPTAFERDVRQSLSAVPTSPDAARTREEVDAFARSLRARARAPAPIPRR